MAAHKMAAIAIAPAMPAIQSTFFTAISSARLAFSQVRLGLDISDRLGLAVIEELKSKSRTNWERRVHHCS
jgi:hypothetical protein